MAPDPTRGVGVRVNVGLGDVLLTVGVGVMTVAITVTVVAVGPSAGGAIVGTVVAVGGGVAVAIGEGVAVGLLVGVAVAVELLVGVLVVDGVALTVVVSVGVGHGMATLPTTIRAATMTALAVDEMLYVYVPGSVNGKEGLGWPTLPGSRRALKPTKEWGLTPWR